MYNLVYYRDINRCAQSMLSKSIFLAYEIGEIELADLPAFTDSELFTIREKSLDNRVRDLLRCIKYRYLYVPTFNFEVDDSFMANTVNKKGVNFVEEELCERINISGKDIDNLLLLDFPPKKKIDKRVYLKKENEEIIPYNFLDNENDEEIIRKYNNLQRNNGYVFIPHSLMSVKDTILKNIEEDGRMQDIKDLTVRD